MSDDDSVRKFKISAPGRIVLSGEHSAMYGRPFVMAGLNLRTNLEFCELRDAPSVIKIEFPDVNLREEILLEDVLFEYKALISHPTDLLDYIKCFITTRGMWQTGQQRFSLLMFFYMFYLFVNREELKILPFHVRVSSDIPIGAGLGSSMSFAICLAACFLHWKRLQSGPHIQFDDDDLSSIKVCAGLCEKLMQDHGFAKFDAEVCTHGKIQKCQLRNYGNYSPDIIDLTTKIKILLLDLEKAEYSKESRELRMAELKKSDKFFNDFLNELGEVATTIFDNLNCIKDTVNNPHDHAAAYEELMNSIEWNHLILRKSWSQRINSIVSFARMYNLKGKFTGFGGRFLYFVLPPNLSIEDIIYIYLRFSLKNVIGIIATINCEGVTLIDN